MWGHCTAWSAPGPGVGTYCNREVWGMCTIIIISSFSHLVRTVSSDFGPKCILPYYVMVLYQKYSLMHQDHNHARISWISLSYVEIFKIKAIEVLIFLYAYLPWNNGTILECMHQH